ncbi:MAG TPA: prepilin-type N-terminal cleavage/methylation domain-containing protein [Armatimonadota bacterium]|nr:prepilin-type N-terminal cleavage/methylation domain-containing protein [Armatimonadota bacterium]HOS43243.1 prepilin-type N-terminal cleavage/methylation domain-containing protein [Armatimonadota bacterium]
MWRIRPPGGRGFTLIELLIVIVVIALLALIVVPRMLGAARRAREATLRDNLHTMRTAISQFFADTNRMPASLHDLIAPAEADVTADIPTDTYKGPYLSSPGGIGGDGLPKNPFADQRSTDIDAHWEYDATQGTVGVPPAQQADAWVTLDGNTYYRDL